MRATLLFVAVLLGGCVPTAQNVLISGHSFSGVSKLVPVQFAQCLASNSRPFGLETSIETLPRSGDVEFFGHKMIDGSRTGIAAADIKAAAQGSTYEFAVNAGIEQPQDLARLILGSC